MKNIEQIAKTAHEVNKAWCELNEDFSQTSWDLAPDWQKESAVNGVEFNINNKATAEEIHQNWMNDKVADNWVYGEVKDIEKKTHPCLVPYHELSYEQKVKDHLFRAVVNSFQ